MVHVHVWNIHLQRLQKEVFTDMVAEVGYSGTMACKFDSIIRPTDK